MGVRIFSSHVSVDGKGIDFDVFPSVIQRYLERTERTLDLEDEAQRLIEDGFQPEGVAQFVRAVCRWGGYSGIAGRVLKNNEPLTVSTAMRAAHACLAANSEDACTQALAEVNRIHGLGTPSFASKHLRFLEPKSCPVLDRVIARTYDYTFSRNGYGSYAGDCLLISRALGEASISNPIEKRADSWYAADVDSVLFALARAW